MTPTANVFNERQKIMCPEIHALFARHRNSVAFSACFLLFMNDEILFGENERDGGKNYLARHKFSCVVASFVWECANSTFIIRIVGFQLYLYTIRVFLRQIHFYGIHVTGWVRIPKNAHISCFIWYATHSDLSEYSVTMHDVTLCIPFTHTFH